MTRIAENLAEYVNIHPEHKNAVAHTGWSIVDWLNKISDDPNLTHGAEPLFGKAVIFSDGMKSGIKAVALVLEEKLNSLNLVKPEKL